MSTEQHKKEAPKKVNCKVITVSDTRTKETDKSGSLMIKMLKENSHSIHDYEIVTDDYEVIKAAIKKAINSMRSYAMRKIRIMSILVGRWNLTSNLMGSSPN